MLSTVLFILSISTPSLASGTSTGLERDANGKFNFVGYFPSSVLTAIAFVLILATALTQTYFMVKQGGRYMLTMVIAEYTLAIGFAMRFPLHSNPYSMIVFIVEQLFIVLSPCGFIAGNYILLGRLAMWLKCGQYMLVPAEKITKFFVLSDVFTFGIQSTGSSLMISKTQTTSQIGTHMFLAGLILQLVSFAFFTILYVKLLFSVYKFQPRIWSKDCGNKEWYNDWRSLAFALCLSCFGIIVRSVYRIIEASQGPRGKFAITESLFYGLDTLPLFIAIVVFTPFWPGRYIPNKLAEEDYENVQVNSFGTVQILDAK
ncbi:RTA1 like protein-domain-containing protein [Abortiporus biennis]|nr:RTA1 like protein-domain-containing protein [Abortiporus biennis]